METGNKSWKRRCALRHSGHGGPLGQYAGPSQPRLPGVACALRHELQRVRAAASPAVCGLLPA
jgi:hypothetical protein